MSALFSLAGLVFLISGLLSLTKISDVGLDFVSRSQIHQLSFLAAYPAVWVYIAFGVLLLIISSFIRR